MEWNPTGARGHEEEIMNAIARRLLNLMSDVLGPDLNLPDPVLTAEDVRADLALGRAWPATAGLQQRTDQPRAGAADRRRLNGSRALANTRPVSAPKSSTTVTMTGSITEVSTVESSRPPMITSAIE